jgi:prophage regulatory protein
MALTGLSRSSIYLRISNKEFPKPIKIGRRAIGWPEDVLIGWQRNMLDGQNEDS